MDIAGKVFIVTGGASGLGEGTARMLAAHGGKVVVADLQADAGQKVAAEIGGVFVKCDVSQEADGQAAVALENIRILQDEKIVERAASRAIVGVADVTARADFCQRWRRSIDATRRSST